MDNTVKEPLIHLSKREDMPSGKRWLVRIAAIFLSLVVCAGFIFMIIKMNPVEVYERNCRRRRRNKPPFLGNSKRCTDFVMCGSCGNTCF